MADPRVLVIATHNVAKAGEMVTILKAGLPGWQIRTLVDYPGAPEPEETGSTYPENARIKALSGARFTGELCIADDAGLEIDALDGAPGVYSKRFGGEGLPFPEKMQLIMDRLAGLNDDQRTARFNCSVVVAGPSCPAPDDLNPLPWRHFSATCEGRIGTEPRGTFGFGYDPIFFVDEAQRHMAELTPEAKHKVSHRGKVLRQVIQALREQPGTTG